MILPRAETTLLCPQFFKRRQNLIIKPLLHLEKRKTFRSCMTHVSYQMFTLLYREFFYIQMEKYARQALSEGVKSDSELHVSEDSELYRVINVHYNRNNHIEVS